MFIELLGFVTTKHRSHIVKNLTLKFFFYNNLKVSPSILAQERREGGMETRRQGEAGREGGREKKTTSAWDLQQMLASNGILREKEVNSYISTSRLLSVVFCMWNITHMCSCMNTWSPDGSAVWDGCRTIRQWRLAEENRWLGWPLRSYNLVPLPVQYKWVWPGSILFLSPCPPYHKGLYTSGTINQSKSILS